MKDNIGKKVIIVFGVLLVGLVFCTGPREVYSACDSGVDCGDIKDAGDCDQCEGKLFCTAACCEYSTTCACEATLCETDDYCGQANCISLGCAPLKDIYSGCPDDYVCKNCTWCGGSPTNCTFTCPSYINPCYSVCPICGVTPTPTPGPLTPTAVPVTPTPVPTSAPNYPSCQIISGRITGVCSGTAESYGVTGQDPDGDLNRLQLWWTVTTNQAWQGPIYDGAVTGIGTVSFPNGGTYYLTCNAYDVAGHSCSGNPWCLEWPPVATPEILCPGWVDCGPSDVIQVTVEQMPTAPRGLFANAPACSVAPVSVSFTWIPVTGATEYLFRLDRRDIGGSASWSGDCGALNPGDLCATPTTNLYSATLDPGYDYYWWVAADNASCPVSSDSAVAQFTMNTCGISGYVYDDPHLTSIVSGSYCTSPNPAAVSPVSNLSDLVIASNLANSGFSIVNDVTGGYSIPIASGLYNVAYNDGGAGYTFVCPATGAYGVVPSNPPQTGVNFFVTTIRDAWMQTIGGDVFAALGNIVNPIPSTCATSPTGCDPYLSIPGTLDEGVIAASGTVNTGYGYTSTEGWVAENTNYGGEEYKFDYWLKKAQADITKVVDCTTYTDPKMDPLNSKSSIAGQVVELNCNQSVELNGIWKSINSKTTLFVNFSDSTNNDLIVNPGNAGTPTKDITLTPNGSLTVVTNGDIVIADGTVGIVGVWIADGSFSTCQSAECGSSIDDQFEVTGSVISWGGINLSRDLGVANNGNPAEIFRYDVKSILNLPLSFGVSHFTWEEVAP